MKSFLKQIHDRLGELWWHAGLSFVISRLGDVVNLFIGLWLVPQFVSKSELGAVLPLVSVGAIFSMPLGICLIPVAKFLSVFVAKGEHGKAKALLRDAIMLSGAFILVLIAMVFWSVEGIMARLHVGDPRMAWPIICFAMLYTK